MDDEAGSRHRGPAAGEVPNEREVADEFPHGDQRPLVEQRPRYDEHGNDVRRYTGEPVETEYGTVLPQQMAVGAQRVVGGGEFPNEQEPTDDSRHSGGSEGLPAEEPTGQEEDTDQVGERRVTGEEAPGDG